MCFLSPTNVSEITPWSGRNADGDGLVYPVAFRVSCLSLYKLGPPNGGLMRIRCSWAYGAGIWTSETMFE